MTRPRQSPPSAAGLGWATLDDGVAYNRAWLTTNTPGLFAAWERAQTQQQRQQIATQIQQAARLAESEGERDSHENYATVTVQWAETTRYEAEFYLDPTSDDDTLWSEIANLSDSERRTLDATDDDNRIVSVVDLDGIASTRERSLASTTVIDFGDIADTIDERIAESSGWPALNRDLNTAAAAGFDVAATLPALAEREPLPNHDPATELRYRLISTGTVPAITVTGSSGHPNYQSPRRDQQPSASPALRPIAAPLRAG